MIATGRGEGTRSRASTSPQRLIIDARKNPERVEVAKRFDVDRKSVYNTVSALRKLVGDRRFG